nr:RNA-directed DNA polymerase, eukaryota [Tanacetum cinerariifolium]
VCIFTKSIKHIFVTLKVEVNGELFDVIVLEIGTWNTNITDTASDVSSQLEANHLDKDDISIEDKENDDLDDIDGILKDLDNDAKNEENVFVSPKEVVPTDKANLIDLPIGGHHFTWMNKAGKKLSKLDRFLISEGVMEDIPDIKVTAIERLWSDHSPILLHSKKADFGPSPFKLYNAWLSIDGFDDIVKST